MKKTFAFFALLTSTSLFSVECGQEPPYRVELRHRDPRGVGYNDGYTTAEFFLSSAKVTSFTPFLDLRGHVFNDGRLAANAGFGARKFFADFLTGLNVYYDYRDIHNLGGQSRIGVGGELLTKWADLRINGYAPVGDSKFADCKSFSHFQCNDAFGKQKIAATLPSIDLEVGAPIPGYLEEIDLYFALGTYYLFEREVAGYTLGQAWDGRARVDLRIYDGIRIGADITYDHIFNTRAQGYIGLSLPLGPSNMRTKGKRFKERYESCFDKALERGRTLQSVYRQEIIPSESRSLEFFLNPCNPIRFVCNTASSGSGTFESPFSTLIAAEQNSLPGDLIYVFYGDGTDKGMNEGIILQENQRLISSGASFELDCFCVPACQDRCKPLITNEIRKGSSEVFDDFFGVQLAQNNEVAGFRFDGKNTAFDAVQSLAATCFTVRMNDLVDASSLLLATSPIENGNIVISENSAQNLQESAIEFQNEIIRSSIAVSGNTVNGSTGLFIVAGAQIADSEIALSCNQILDFHGGSAAFFDVDQILGSSLLFADNSIEGGSQGILFESGANFLVAHSEFVFSGNSFSAVDIPISFQDPSTLEGSRLIVRDNSFDGGFFAINFGDGVKFQSSSLDIESNQFLNHEHYGVYIANHAINSLDGHSVIAIEHNLFDQNDNSFVGFLKLVPGAKVDFSGNQVFNSTDVFALFDNSTTASTGGIVIFNENDIDFYSNGIRVDGPPSSPLTPIVLDQLIVQNNQALHGLSDPNAYAVNLRISGGAAICIENNLFSNQGAINNGATESVCVSFVGNTFPVVGFGNNGGTFNLESSTGDLTGVMESNNVGSYTHGTLTFLPLGTCGCSCPSPP